MCIFGLCRPFPGPPREHFVQPGFNCLREHLVLAPSILVIMRYSVGVVHSASLACAASSQWERLLQATLTAKNCVLSEQPLRLLTPLKNDN